jgi:hypothetical protein
MGAAREAAVGAMRHFLSFEPVDCNMFIKPMERSVKPLATISCLRLPNDECGRHAYICF